MKTELSNLCCLLAEIRDKLEERNVIEAQRNEIMKEMVWQKYGSDGINRKHIDNELIKQTFKELIKQALTKKKEEE